MPMIEAQGYGVRVRFDGQFIVIRRGAVSRAAGGSGQSVIPLAQVEAVDWKPAGWLWNGYIRFRVAGGAELRVVGGVPMAPSDEFSAVFTIMQRRRFERLRKAVDGALAARTFQAGVWR